MAHRTSALYALSQYASLYDRSGNSRGCESGLTAPIWSTKRLRGPRSALSAAYRTVPSSRTYVFKMRSNAATSGTRGSFAAYSGKAHTRAMVIGRFRVIRKNPDGSTTLSLRRAVKNSLRPAGTLG